jgi:glyoxylase-like metal-dependent hydrolase (beta-lactamase superfamily II)
MALVACPTASIGTSPKTDASPGVSGFPERIGDGVYYCGFTSASSFGASSYLIQRPQGNVLIDSPRAAGPLLQRIAELGGVRWMFLTHRDDVADHRAFRQHFGCERLLHRGDISPDTAEIEIPFDGGEIIPLAPDLKIVPVPGHTRGSAALLYRDALLFTGDHLWGSEDGAGLSASRAVCWFSWAEQVRSLERLLELSFQWVLPGHGRQLRLDSTAAMHQQLIQLLRRLRAS